MMTSAEQSGCSNFIHDRCGREAILPPAPLIQNEKADGRHLNIENQLRVANNDRDPPQEITGLAIDFRD
jgi:hypothetical protein